MAEIPHQILSDHFQELMDGRRLIAAVFLTFRFDPAFFEREVLPVFLDIPLSHAAEIKLVQLEDTLRTVPDGIAVYYDQNGLSSDTGPAKLDIKRIPVHHRTGIFHPKNVFALVEEEETDEEGHKARTLLVGCQSANLTRAGWWENVEVCHTEEIGEGEVTSLRDDLLALLEGIERRKGGGGGPEEHAPLSAIKGFLRQKTSQRRMRSSNGFIYPHFYNGRNSVAEFLTGVVNNSLKGLNLEIISPYFNQGGESTPLTSLIDTFSPKEVRIMLPLNDKGEATCLAGLYDWVINQGASWAKLPDSLLSSGSGAGLKKRFVHAKVYRFFSKQPKREVIFVGSVNLTSAAHDRDGNQESGFLIEVDTLRRPDWWLKTEDNRPGAFVQKAEDEGTATDSGTRLRLRFFWDSEKAEAFWDEDSKKAEYQSPPLSIDHLSVPLFDIPPMPAKSWVELPADSAQILKGKLTSTSIFQVRGDRSAPIPILVQEEGMSHKPSLLFTLSPADILRYWALLTAEQRASFLANNAPASVLTGEDGALVSRYVPMAEHHTLFDRFAGIFHAFGCLERSVSEALSTGKEKEATYRLFGRKYDSLGNLLERIAKEDEGGDLIENYVIALCAQQLLNEIQRKYCRFWENHQADAERLRKELALVEKFRTRIAEKDQKDMPSFLSWFEGWFLKRAEPLEQEGEG
jgi:hypothetical protein